VPFQVPSFSRLKKRFEEGSLPSQATTSPNAPIQPKPNKWETLFGKSYAGLGYPKSETLNQFCWTPSKEWLSGSSKQSDH